MKTTVDQQTIQCIDSLLHHHHRLLNDGIVALPIKEVIGELETVKMTILASDQKKWCKK